ncbi:MAG TPA: S8 family serine peptidase [Steroidobacter sp.]|uniref:subtilisin-like serine protease QhpE n=1 Tax=Steroidobacter sp. TaxID=1978227 RepID=UPI002EDB31CD
MSENRWTVAVIDSGLQDTSRLSPLACRRFVDDGNAVQELDAVPALTDHGSAVAEIIASGGADLLIAQVTDASGRTTPACVAAAIQWAQSQDARLIHMSLGLSNARAVLAAAVRESIDAGIIIVASTPARGVTTYPANHEGVIRATGDARCMEDEVSWLGTPQADFGGCVVRSIAGRAARGASIGAAHVSRFIVSRLPPLPDHRAVRAALASLAAHRGCERRTS